MLASVAALSPCWAADVDYQRDIKPLLHEKCSSCHGALKQEAGLRLDHGAFIREGGEAGQIIQLKDPAASTLIERVASRDVDLRMPPEGEGSPLNQDQIRRLQFWIESGAPSPEDELVPPSPDEHWAWQPPRQRQPTTRLSGWERNPIDAFVSCKLSEHGLSPNEIADPRTRLRRLYFDLIGLPPSPSALRTFAADPSDVAWARHVDQLLESPAHGQRWARHWMDVWRYSDWDGYKDAVRGSQRHIWRWRDWIVESLNADKGYDQMIVEMLAGDEVASEDFDVLRATGFLARNFHNSNRNIWLDATVEHTAKAFLGLTLNCARCHDHKYDPISHQEYYAFRAIFEPHNVRTERLPGERNTLLDGLVRAYDAKPDEPTYVYQAGNEKMPDKDHPLMPEVPAILGFDLVVEPIALDTLARIPDFRTFVADEDLSAARGKVEQLEKRIKKLGRETEKDKDPSELNWLNVVADKALADARCNLASLNARWKADRFRYASGEDRSQCNEYRQLKLAAAQAEHAAKVAAAELALVNAEQQQQKLANAEKTDEAAVKKAKTDVENAKKALKEAEESYSADKPKYTSVVKVYPASSTGRRLALARWITDRRHPLTARVAVNYVWMNHFGEPLVENVFDFGLRSPKPEYLDLLDWLAVDLMEHDWSFKRLHRLITTSHTYQLSSSTTAGPRPPLANELDPDNRLFWRANVRRLDAEVVRDSLLAVGRSLDARHGGPDIDFTLGETNPRRSLYFRTAYEKQMPMLVIFDAAAPTECYRRSTSIIPQQALALSNSPLAYDTARRLARHLWDSRAQDQPRDQELISTAFEILMGRPCNPTELDYCLDFLIEQTRRLQKPDRLTRVQSESQGQTQPSKDAALRARESLIHALINHNEFVTVR